MTRLFPAFDHEVVLSAPFGAIGLVCTDDCILRIDFLPPGAPERSSRRPIAQRALDEIRQYLAHPAHRLDLPLAPRGSDFMQRMGSALRDIPPGHTRLYAELARQLSSSPRAVGRACSTNPYPLVIPCHRVIGKKGLQGFAGAREGYLLEIKRWLLQHESLSNPHPVTAAPIRA